MSIRPRPVQTSPKAAYVSASLKIKYPALATGALSVLLGGMVLLGWLLDIPMLTRANPEWSPMVPGTAVCFLLSGLTLLVNRASSDKRIPVVQHAAIWLIFLLAGARTVELLSGRDFGVSFLTMPWMNHRPAAGQMSPQTVIGFLIFVIGMLANLRTGSTTSRIFARSMAGLLLIVGLGDAIGYGLNFQYFFEPLYVKTGLIWMSLPTALGMVLLGSGLLWLARPAKRETRTTPVVQRAAQIYRMTLFVVAITSITTSLAGLWFLNNTVLEQTTSNLKQLLDTKEASLSATLDQHTQRALVAGLDSQIKSSASLALARESTDRTSLRQLANIVAPLLEHGFSGIGLQSANERTTVAGRMLPEAAQSVSLPGADMTQLVWSSGYYLRVLMPIHQDQSSVPAGYLIFELALPDVDSLFKVANRWGQTGAMTMCARLDQKHLLCFPQREQKGMFEVADTINGAPLPVTYALAGRRGVARLVDYRGHVVLAAYSPLDKSGLGLVLRQDLVELYAPDRDVVLLSTPLFGILLIFGLWITRLRIKPLLADMAAIQIAEGVARARFEAASQSSPDAFFIYECMDNEAGEIHDLRLVYLNRNAADLIRGSTAKPVGHSFLDMFPEQAEVFIKYKTVFLAQAPMTEEFSLINKQGSEHWYVRQAVPMTGGVAVTIRDITQKRLLIRNLELSNELRTAIVESAAYCIISTDIDGTILTFNKTAERMLWYHADEVVGKTTPSLFHDAEEVRQRAKTLSDELGRTVKPDFDVFVAKAKMNLSDEREWTYIRKDGSRLPVQLSVTALHDKDNHLHGFLGIAHDISEQKRAAEYIRHIALHDVLTGLPNRALLDDRVMWTVEQERREGGSFALAMIDIDRFKHINDSMGHHIGDRLLKEFVERTQSCLRPTDTLARMGGDEFVLLLPNCDEIVAAALVERVQANLSHPINVGLQEVHISASIGISLFPRDGQNFQELLRCADVAMYWVKGHGRNGFMMFSRTMDGGGVDRLNLENDLHFALRNNGFTLFYQPKVDLLSNTVIGVEALLRMRKADNQHVSPDSFIPLAEETGLIVPIGQWVLETACRDAGRMSDLLGRLIKVAVNVSPRQFLNGDLVNTVKDVLERQQFDASQLELEITESVLMDDRSGVSSALRELHTLGVAIAIDDFGTGYSSLSYLKRYPISQLKIDKSFIRDITTDSGDAALVKAIISMGHSLNIPVVAEGIETDEQLAFLTQNHCDHAQGFYIGHPMPFDELLKWFVDADRWVLNSSSADRSFLGNS